MDKDKAIALLSIAVIMNGVAILFMQKAMKLQDDMMKEQNMRISALEKKPYEEAVAKKAEEQ